jgi:hypothetical protein
VAEIEQVFEDLQALEPVEKQDIPKNVRALGSHLFTVEKFMATVAIHTIMSTLAVAACNGNYTLGKLDVKGVFIQTKMKGTPVYIKCRGQLSNLIMAKYPKYSQFVRNDGILYCRLKKALDGCIQASELWYEKLKGFLQEVG